MGYIGCSTKTVKARTHGTENLGGIMVHPRAQSAHG